MNQIQHLELLILYRHQVVHINHVVQECASTSYYDQYLKIYRTAASDVRKMPHSAFA